MVELPVLGFVEVSNMNLPNKRHCKQCGVNAADAGGVWFVSDDGCFCTDCSIKTLKAALWFCKEEKMILDIPIGTALVAVPEYCGKCGGCFFRNEEDCKGISCNGRVYRLMECNRSCLDGKNVLGNVEEVL